MFTNSPLRNTISANVRWYILHKFQSLRHAVKRCFWLNRLFVQRAHFVNQRVSRAGARSCVHIWIVNSRKISHAKIRETIVFYSWNDFIFSTQTHAHMGIILKVEYDSRYESYNKLGLTFHGKALLNHSDWQQLISNGIQIRFFLLYAK